MAFRWLDFGGALHNLTNLGKKVGQLSQKIKEGSSRRKFPPLHSFTDVVISPFTELLDNPRGGRFHRGGPSWPDWECQVEARHCQGGRVRDDEPVAVDPLSVIEHPVAWAGPMTWHFGHQIADFSTRLALTATSLPEVPVLYAAKPATRIEYPRRLPSFFLPILAWFGINSERIIQVRQPTLARELLVAPQGEQIWGPGPNENYLDLLDLITTKRLGTVTRSGVVYVSRAGMPARFAGEAYIEQIFRSAGMQVLRPETIPLEVQLQTYASASYLIFAEGSAIHGLQLLGRGLGDVLVLTRRSGKRIAEPSLGPRVESLRYMDATEGLVHGLDLSGSPASYFGLSVLNPDRLLEGLVEAGLKIHDLWDPSKFIRARDRDIDQWLALEQESPRWKVPGSRELVAESLARCGIARSLP